MTQEETVPGMNKWPKGECWKVADAILQDHGTERILLHGPSGTGKTFIAERLKRSPDEVVLFLTLTPDMPESRILGKWKPKVTPQGTELVWSYGVGAQAFLLSHKGLVTLVLNEINHGGMDVISALHPILDDKETAIIVLDNDETITRTSNLRVIGTMNEEPNALLPSLADRFPISIKIDSIHPEALLCLDEDLRTLAAKTSVSSNPEEHIPFRKWLEFSRLRKKHSAEIAMKAVLGERWCELKDALKTSAA
jgi:MoxR-like ATPase